MLKNDLRDPNFIPMSFLADNILTFIPTEIGFLTKLTQLNLCKLNDPEVVSIRCTFMIQWLYPSLKIRHDFQLIFQKEVFNLRNDAYACFFFITLPPDNNKLSSLPSEIESLTRLDHLDLSKLSVCDQ